MSELDEFRLRCICGEVVDFEDLFVHPPLPIQFSQPLPKLRVFTIAETRGMLPEQDVRLSPIIRGILLNAPLLEHLQISHQMIELHKNEMLDAVVASDEEELLPTLSRIARI